jgi:ABC-type multidrug transport system permease subunit
MATILPFLPFTLLLVRMLYNSPLDSAVSSKEWYGSIGSRINKIVCCMVFFVPVSKITQVFFILTLKVLSIDSEKILPDSLYL